jgi:hypothetical protein
MMEMEMMVVMVMNRVRSKLWNDDDDMIDMMEMMDMI